ncbi:multiheme c-type cytochrome [Tundrisphaera lichenicola]|uniref:multiheme c-type cytochrome n=1 Tax=Tundrisphaera lichenicola TaxID=2029860 RepID=UPI003EBC7DCB
MTSPSHEPGPDIKPEPPGMPGALKEVAIIAVALSALLAGLIAWSRSGPGPVGPGAARPSADPKGPVASLFAGDRACETCHPGEAASHRQSGHSQTLHRAADRAKLLDGRAVADEEFDATWDYSLRDGTLTARRTEADQGVDYILDYAFGSGHHATTFVGMTDRTPSDAALLEHRMTYFARDGSLHTTPGQAKDATLDRHELSPAGRAHGVGKTLECFECHSTLLSEDGGRVLDLATMVPNISCERCHGPGRDHIKDARNGVIGLRMPFGAGREPAERQMRLCGQCHRHPDMAPAGSIHPANLEIVRYQPVGLMQSKCYTRTPGGISCTTCHDPHASVSADSKSYEASCLDCHSDRPQVLCPVSPTSGCISCHMPARDAGQEVMFHDHWIRARPASPTGAD